MIPDSYDWIRERYAEKSEAELRKAIEVEKGMIRFFNAKNSVPNNNKKGNRDSRTVSAYLLRIAEEELSRRV